MHGQKHVMTRGDGGAGALAVPVEERAIETCALRHSIAFQVPWGEVTLRWPMRAAAVEAVFSFWIHSYTSMERNMFIQLGIFTRPAPGPPIENSCRGGPEPAWGVNVAGVVRESRTGGQSSLMRRRQEPQLVPRGRWRDRLVCGTGRKAGIPVFLDIQPRVAPAFGSRHFRLQAR